jgi:hypothetical protein
LDDISIPEIGYLANFEQDTDGWESEGWARIQNVLTQDFAVQMIEISNDGTTTVTRLLMPNQGSQGEWDVTFSDDTRKVIFVLAAFAPLTTETATFSLTLELHSDG